MYDFEGIKVGDSEAKEILDTFKEKYINKSYPEKKLFINHLIKIERKIPIRRIRELNISLGLDLFMYHERLKTLYITTFEDICEYLKQLGPWQDIDCLVFDEKFNWFVGITHNDTLLIYGL